MLADDHTTYLYYGVEIKSCRSNLIFIRTGVNINTILHGAQSEL